MTIHQRTRPDRDSTNNHRNLNSSSVSQDAQRNTRSGALEFDIDHCAVQPKLTQYNSVERRGEPWIAEADRSFDNDTAFAQHGLLRTMRDMTTWFCDAYASWQKGGIENANGRLRRWLPRHLDIDRTSDQEIQEIVLTTNLTPRKCLGFKTPFQALIAELGKDVQIRFS